MDYSCWIGTERWGREANVSKCSTIGPMGEKYGLTKACLTLAAALRFLVAQPVETLPVIGSRRRLLGNTKERHMEVHVPLEAVRWFNDSLT